jgi:peptide/nickel transport system permease protein
VAIVLVVLGLTLVGESLNDLADPRLRTRRAAGSGSSVAGEVAVVPGGPLGAGPAGLAGLEGNEPR